MRTPITLKIKFKSSNLDQFIERYSVDVSRGGIFIRTKEPLPVGTQLKFEFQLQDAQSLIAGDGTVVWIREHDPSRAGVAPGMGVRFDRLAPQSMGVLEKILAEKQKRGDAQLESRFDAGVRASASVSGTLGAPQRSMPSAARMAAHNDFSGGDSKQHTPLPAPMPGLDANDEFGNESTRVMQNEMVERLAQQTRDEAEEAFGDEPTRKATPSELNELAQSAGPTVAGKVSASTSDKVEVAPEVAAAADKPAEKPAAAAAAPAPAPAADEKKAAEKPAAEKAPAKEERPAAAAAPAAAAEEKKAPAKEPARRVEPADRTDSALPLASARPPARSGPSLAPIFIIIAILAAAGGYYVYKSQETPATPQPEVAKPTPPEQPAEPVAKPDEPTPAKPDEPTAVAKPDEPTPAKPDEPTAVAKPEEPTPAPTPEKPAEPVVTIKSEPVGATILVDGKPIEQLTPAELSNLQPNKPHVIMVTLEGHLAWKGTLKPGQKELNVKLTPKERQVQVSSTPAGADVFLDGKRVGKTPLTIARFDASKPHELEVKRAGYLPQTRTIDGKEGWQDKGPRELLAVAVTLEEQPKAPKPVAAAPEPTVKKPTAALPKAKPEEPKPVAEKPAAEKPVAEKPVAEKPVAEKPVAEKPVAEKPVAEKPDAEKPAAEKPVAEKPVAEKPVEKPAAEKPAEKPPEKPAEKPEGEDKPASGGPIKVPAWMKKGESQPAPTPAPAPETDSTPRPTPGSDDT